MGLWNSEVIDTKVDKVPGSSLVADTEIAKIHDQVHGLGSADHAVATLAELNAKVSDATLIDTNDSRLSDSRPASDVYDWAKAASKPDYTAVDVGLGSVPNVDATNMANWQQKGATEGQAPVWSGTTWVPSNVSASGGVDVVRTPTAVAPLTGDTNVSLTPELSANAYANIYSAARDYREFQVDVLTGDFSVPVYTFSGDTNTHIVATQLSILTDYKWRCRDVSIEGDASAWMEVQSFETANIYISTPTNSSPADTEADIGETPTLTSSAFSCINGTDTHASSDWEVYDGVTLIYSSYDDASNLTTLTVPEGNLVESTTYTWRVRHTGAVYGDSEWSTATSFTTKASFATIYGIARVNDTGLSGTWVRIDGNGNDITLTSTDFDNHPVWGNIETVIIDGQSIVKIPKFYSKTGPAPVGSDRAGKPCWWVSDVAAPGFDLNPAFMDGGVEIDQFYYGAYECSDDGGTKAASVSGAAPLVSIDFTTMQARCTARNTGGVDGFAMVDIYQLSAVQLLCLIETGTADVQSAIGAGNTSSSVVVNTGTTNAVWRGIYELWGNVWCMVNGLILETDHEVKIWDKNGNRVLQSTGVTTGSTDGWIKSMHDDSGIDWDLGAVFLPEVVDAAEANSTFGDYLYASDAGETNVCYHGGHWYYGSGAGLFFLALADVASGAAAHIGSRLAKV